MEEKKELQNEVEIQCDKLTSDYLDKLNELGYDTIVLAVKANENTQSTLQGYVRGTGKNLVNAVANLMGEKDNAIAEIFKKGIVVRGMANSLKNLDLL